MLDNLNAYNIDSLGSGTEEGDIENLKEDPEEGLW